MEFETLREKAESRKVAGSGFTDASVSVLCMQNAALTKNKKTLVLASLGNTLAFPQASAQMRRLFGPCGSESRQDVPAAQDMDTVSEVEDFEAWMADRKAARATREGGGQGNRDRRAETESGRTTNPINRRRGQRNRCYTRHGEFDYVPQCPRKKNRNSGAPSPLKTREKSSNIPYSSIAMESPVEVGSPPKSASAGPAR